ncbi:hypothetical protein V8G54_018203 [Vigna mungo]|uniref:Uncharacterized protein n=1 Tax=Vigna mungo TaxID=3915 RepID=A0AAQ3N8E0_VIGMU
MTVLHYLWDRCFSTISHVTFAACLHGTKASTPFSIFGLYIRVTRVRYSTDKSTEPTPGKAIGVGQHMIYKGEIMIQSVEPIKHTCSFAIYSHDMSRQIETHHYYSRLHQNFIQFAVYDSDELGASLLDLLLFSLFLFQLYQNSISYSWSSCVEYIVKLGLWVNPRVPELIGKSELENLAKTYGKFCCTWLVDRGTHTWR